MSLKVSLMSLSRLCPDFNLTYEKEFVFLTRIRPQQGFFIFFRMVTTRLYVTFLSTKAKCKQLPLLAS